MKQSPKSALVKAPVHTRSYPALVLLEEQPGLGAPLGVLTFLLAETLALTFGDSVIVVHIVPETEAAHPVGAQPGPRRVDRIFLQTPAEPAAAAAHLAPEIARLGEIYAYVLLDASRRTGPFTRELTAHLASSDLGGVMPRLSFFTKDHASPPPSPGWSTLRVDLLTPHAPPRRVVEAESGSLPTGLRRHVTGAWNLVEALGSRLGGTAVEPEGEEYPDARLSPEVCRARLDIAALAASYAPTQPPDLTMLPRETRATLDRWARALTYRRVGVALGGSGSWGYAHVALLEELEHHGVPVDIVGGSSSGALMGSYYAALGRPGLALAIRRGKRFSRTAWLATITSTAVDLTVDADLGGVLLEDLEVILLPVATNLSRGRAEVITRSCVSAAVRASSSAPGVFASTITRTGLYVDGAISDNMPVVLVERWGADLLVACNGLPPPENVHVRTPGSALQDFIAEFNPMNRLRDLAVSFAHMCHDFGDCEEASMRIIYEPPPDGFPLFRTFEFHRAEEIIKKVREEHKFQEMVMKSVEAYRRLVLPRRAREGDG
jgi:predicted acylesterase/phospholipase RssA